MSLINGKTEYQYFREQTADKAISITRHKHEILDTCKGTVSAKGIEGVKDSESVNESKDTQHTEDNKNTKEIEEVKKFESTEEVEDPHDARYTYQFPCTLITGGSQNEMMPILYDIVKDHLGIVLPSKIYSLVWHTVPSHDASAKDRVLAMHDEHMLMAAILCCKNILLSNTLYLYVVKSDDITNLPKIDAPK